MSAPTATDIAAWATAISTLIILIQQKLNADAGKQRGETMQKTVQGTKEKVEDIHTSTLNGQIEILKSRATALRTLATLRQTKEDEIAALRAELDLFNYINKGATSEKSTVDASGFIKPISR